MQHHKSITKYLLIVKVKKSLKIGQYLIMLQGVYKSVPNFWGHPVGLYLLRHPPMAWEINTKRTLFTVKGDTTNTTNSRDANISKIVTRESCRLRRRYSTSWYRLDRGITWPVTPGALKRDPANNNGRSNCVCTE